MGCTHPGVVESVVSTGTVGSTSPLGNLGEETFFGGRGKRTSYERQPSEDGSEVNHDE